MKPATIVAIQPTIDHAVIAEQQRNLHAMLLDLARLVPEYQTATTVCNLRNTIRQLVSITDTLAEAVIIADQRAAAYAADAVEARMAAADDCEPASDGELRLVPLNETEADPTDGRSIQRRNTEALFAGRRPAT